MANENELIKLVQKNLLEGLSQWVGYAILNKNKEYLFVNDFLLNQCGYSKEELIGSTVELLNSGMKNSHYFEQGWDDLVHNGSGWQGEVCLRKKNGEFFWNQVTRTALQSPNHTEALYLEIHVDKTELKIKEQEIEKQKKLAQAGARFSILGQMIGGITHEINNPLTVILGTAKYFKMANAKNEITSEFIEKNAQKIMDASNRISRVTKVAKSLSRDGSNDPFVSHSAEALFEDINSLVGTRVRNHGITLEFTLPNKEAKVTCRPFDLMQAILNLIYNSDVAVRNSESPWIRLSFEATEEFNFFRVTDSGKGIQSNIEEDIMNPFFTTKAFGAGMGLGLGLTKEIIEKHSGHFYLDKRSQNTCFVIQIPKSLNHLS